MSKVAYIKLKPNRQLMTGFGENATYPTNNYTYSPHPNINTKH